MIEIGVTQRVTVVEEYDESRDCLDQRWGPLLRSFGFLPVPLFNRIDDVGEYVSDLDLDGVLLTGGNDIASATAGSSGAPDRDAFERELLDVAFDRDLPVLGVCRGAQLINVHCGGSLSPVDGHVATTHDVSIANLPLDGAPARATTNSYHDYGITEADLAEDLRIAGRSQDGTVEWLYHDARPVSGIMWHPERESPSSDLDRRIIQERLGSTNS